MSTNPTQHTSQKQPHNPVTTTQLTPSELEKYIHEKTQRHTDTPIIRATNRTKYQSTKPLTSHLVPNVAAHEAITAALTKRVVILETAVDITHPLYDADDPSSWFTFERPCGVLEFTSNRSEVHIAGRPEKYSLDAESFKIPKHGKFVCECDGEIIFIPIYAPTIVMEPPASQQSEGLLFDVDGEVEDNLLALALPLYSRFYHIVECKYIIDDRTTTESFVETIPTELRGRLRRHKNGR